MPWLGTEANRVLPQVSLMVKQNSGQGQEEHGFVATYVHERIVISQSGMSLCCVCACTATWYHRCLCLSLSYVHALAQGQPAS